MRVCVIVARSADSAGDHADAERHQRADEEKPGVRDVGERVYANHREQSGDHACKRAVGVGAPVERPEKEESEQARQRQGNDGQRGLQQLSPRQECKPDQHESPKQCDASCQSQEFLGLRGAATHTREIQHAGSRQGIQRTAGIGHRHRENRSKQQTGQSYGHFTHQKKWQDPLRFFPGCEYWPVLCEDKEQHADQKKHRELYQHQEAAGQ